MKNMRETAWRRNAMAPRRKAMRCTAARPKLKLTISLLVSNRMDTVRRCLESVQPLLEAVPSELIVVDTVGEENSDGSLAAAKEFTDHIIHFDWCGDFSAARNAGLSQARGEWFLFLDDDEWFEDVSPIITFLQQDKGQYHTCYYRQRNYLNQTGKLYKDTWVLRMARCYPGLRFEDRIHEYLTDPMGPTYQLNAFVHHYGYVFKTLEERDRHSERNVKLLKELLEDRPLYLRAMMQLAQEYGGIQDFQKEEQICRSALDHYLKKGKNSYLSWIAANYILTLLRQKKWDEAREQAEALLEHDSISEMAKANICFYRQSYAARMASSLQERDNIRLYFQYADFLDAYPEQKIQQLMLDLDTVLRDDMYEVMLQAGIRVAKQLEDWDEAKKYFIRLCHLKGPEDSSENTVLRENLPIVLETAHSLGHLRELLELLTPSLADDALRAVFAENAEKVLEHSADKEAAEDALADLPYDEPYFLLQRIRRAGRTHEQEQLHTLLPAYFHTAGYEGHFHEILELIYQNNLPLDSANISLQAWEAGIYRIAHQYSVEGCRLRQAYLLQFLDRSAPEMQLYTAMIALKQLTGDENGPLPQYKKILYQYIDSAYQYYHAIFHPDNFTANRSRYLPNQARAVYYLHESVLCEQQKKTVEQVHALREALNFNRSLIEPVQKIIAEIETKLQADREAVSSSDKEFSLLAARMKQAIETLIHNGDYTAAKETLDQLSQLLPGDADIKNLYVRICQ